MLTAARLVELADEIDNRLGPIPGGKADWIAIVLRRAAEQIEALERQVYVPGLF